MKKNLSKKNISVFIAIILVFCILFSCLQMSGCAIINDSIWDKNEEDKNEEDKKEEDKEDEVIIPKPLNLSKQGGAYATSFVLTVTPQYENHKIYYTTDCEEPTLDSKIFPTSGISIADVTDTATYYIGSKVSNGRGNYTMMHGTTVRLLETDDEDNIVAKKIVSYIVRPNSDEIFTVPTVFLTVNKKEFIDNGGANGQNFYNTGTNSARPTIWGNIEYYTKNSTDSFNLETKMSIGGDGSASNPQRTINVNFNKDKEGYKNEKVKVDVFNGAEKIDGTGKLTDLTRFRLHGGGSSVYTSAGITSAYIDTLARKSGNVAAASYSPSMAFINGEFWGVYYIREQISDTYFEDNYSVDKNDVVLMDKGWLSASNSKYITVNGTKYYNYGFTIKDSPDVETAWKLLADLYSKDLYEGDLSNETLYKKFCDKVDIYSLIDCYLIQTYIGNWDYGFNNVRIWRTINVDKNNPYADGKWRFAVHDTDYGLVFNDGRRVTGSDSFGTLTEFDMFDGVKAKLSHEDSYFIQAPMRNEGFRKLLIERAKVIMEMYQNNAEKTLEDMMDADFKTAYSYNVKRWNYVNVSTLSTNMNTRKNNAKKATFYTSNVDFVKCMENSVARYLNKIKSISGNYF